MLQGAKRRGKIKEQKPKKEKNKRRAIFASGSQFESLSPLGQARKEKRKKKKKNNSS